MPNIEDHIQKAIQEGQFEDLPGKGKPLRIDDDPLADPEWRLAHHMLKSSGYTLPWIEARQSILAELETARADLARAWAWCQIAGNTISTENQTPCAMIEKQWQRALAVFADKTQKLNKRIFHYNLEAPSPQFQIALINTERELVALTGDG